MQLDVLAYSKHGTARTYADKVAIVGVTRILTFANLWAGALRLVALLVTRADVICWPIAVRVRESGEVAITNLGILYSANAYRKIDVKSPL